MCLSGNPPNVVFLLCAYSSVVAMWKINFLSLSSLSYNVQIAIRGVLFKEVYCDNKPRFE